ncbi:MAG: ATP-binding protein [Bdellovibrio bacteriovorus]
MTESRRILWLILIMMVAVTVSTGVAIAVLYRTAFEQERSHLIQAAEDQAHLMDAVAKFDREHGTMVPGAPEAATLSQIQTAFDHYPTKGEIAEIVVGRRQEEGIVLLVTHGGTGSEVVGPIPWESGLAEPMRRALSGQSGSMIGLDYRGERVLAAYHPVHALGAGVVAKVDLAVLRAPFLRGAAMVIGIALVLFSVGTVLVMRLTNPIIRHLDETERRYRRIFRGAPVPIWEQDLSGIAKALQTLRDSGVTDLDRHLAEHPEALGQLLGAARIREANAAALKLFGVRSDRQLAAWFRDEVVPATHTLACDVLRALWAGQEVLLNRSVSVRTPDGRDLTVIFSMLVPSPTEGYQSVALSALDVTAGLNLRRREDELALILASTGEGIFGMDLDGRCSFVNRAALHMLGYRHERDLLGEVMHGLIHRGCPHQTPSPQGGCSILRACCQGTPVRLDDELLWRADGTSFPAAYSAYPMLRDGTIVGTVVTFTDITERRERESQLVQSQKLEVVGQLTGAIAHDFNNLLAIILTNLQVLEERLEDTADDEIGEIIDDARSAARDGASLTRRLLSFSRQQPLEPQWMEVDAFLQHTGRFLRRVAGEGIALEVQRSGGSLPVRVDRQQLENVILNLAINARDAMPAGGTLTVAGRRERLDGEEAARLNLTPGSYVVVSISDTGIGMSPEVARRAVEPFYSTKPVGKGSGLGLSTALRFAQQSGGDLRIESAPGQGTSVSLYLPEAAAAAVEAERVVAIPRPSKGLPTVLVVDDERRMRRLARRILSDLGCHVLEADNAASAARLLEQDAGIDLLFTDVVMPGEIDGRTLGQWARQKRPALKVLLTSGYSGLAEEDTANGDEALPFLKKPYSEEQLREIVQTLLDTAAS